MDLCQYHSFRYHQGTSRRLGHEYDQTADSPSPLSQTHRLYSRKGTKTKRQNFALYSCDDGELHYYVPEKATKETKSAIKKDCTDFAWKPDHSCVALGFEDGSISFLNRDLKEIGQPIYALKKFVQYLAWHPDSTAKDLNLSPFRNYLATAINATTVTIFDLSDLIDGIDRSREKSAEETSADSTVTQHKVVATLCGHAEKIVSLAWSSHFSGPLVSGSYDCTAQVWEVEIQELIVTYTGHTAPVQSCMWSPLDPGYIITGSSDFTIRVWKVSDQEVCIPTEKPQTKRMRTKKNNKNKIATKALASEAFEESFLCHGLLNWLNDNGAKAAASLDNVVGLIGKLLRDAIDKQTVKYWTATSEMNKLEASLCPGARFLRCYNPELLKCPGKGKLDHNGVFTMTEPHFVECADPFIVEKAEHRKGLYDGVKDVPRNPKEIYEIVSREKQVGAQFTSYPNVKSSMLEWRNESQPPIPRCMTEITEALECQQWKSMLTYSVTVADKDSGTTETTDHRLQAWTVRSIDSTKTVQGVERNEERFHVIFGTPTYAEKFVDNDRAFVDCTFDVTPNVAGAYQLLTVMIEHGKVVLPVAWSIMQRKNEGAYDAVIKGIKENVLPAFEPSWAMTDFEQAIKNSLQTNFPTVTVHGCYFHHCHAVLNYRQRLRIMTRVVKHIPHMHAEACRYEKDLMNLALLPKEYIVEAFDDLRKRLKENVALSEIMDSLFKYYEAFWIKKKGPASYSVYKEQRRTNNAIERYHRSLKEEMATKPEFYKFIGGLKKIQERAHCDLLVMEQGALPYRPRSQKAQDRSNTLNVVWDDLGDLASDSRNQRQKKYIRFLRDVRSDTVLSIERSSVDAEGCTQAIDVIDTFENFPDGDVSNEFEGSNVDQPCENDAINDPICKHFVVGCTTCNNVEIARNQEHMDLIDIVNNDMDSAYSVEEATFIDNQQREDFVLFDPVVTDKSRSEGDNFNFNVEESVPSQAMDVSTLRVVTNLKDDDLTNVADKSDVDIRTFLSHWTEYPDEDMMVSNVVGQFFPTIDHAMIEEESVLPNKLQPLPQDDFQRWMILKKSNRQKRKNKQETIMCIKP